jgi:hypothetical protein
MNKTLAAAIMLAAAGAAAAQAPAPGKGASPVRLCPAGMHATTIRHDLVKPGKWAEFEQAVAAHNAWYAAHGDRETKTELLRAVARKSGGSGFSTSEAATITHYSAKPAPAHDAAWNAFIAQYRDSSKIKDELRVCMS